MPPLLRNKFGAHRIRRPEQLEQIGFNRSALVISCSKPHQTAVNDSPGRIHHQTLAIALKGFNHYAIFVRVGCKDLSISVLLDTDEFLRCGGTGTVNMNAK